MPCVASPLFFLRDGGADPPWYPPTPMGAVSAGWMGEGPGRESGSGGGGGRGEGDILLAMAAPDGEAMEFRGGTTYSGGAARRGGREGSRGTH